VPEPTRGKRRRGTQQGRRADGYSRASQGAGPRRAGAPAGPVGGGGVTSNIPGVPWIIGGAIVLVVVVAAFLILRPGAGSSGVGAGPSGSAGQSTAAGASTSAGAGSAAAAGNCPTSQPPALPAGQTRTVTLTTDKGSPIVIKIAADLSPIAAGNFVALASCGYYDGTVIHRVVPKFVIQGGDPTGTGTGGPGYTIKDEPVTATYSRGTVAMARTAQPDSVGSQFFIVLDDTARQALASANTYQIIGTVTSGMATVDAIAAAADKENPTNPVAITTATVANP
jgi:cyclophilin family peptidyl-prolyl cis-trans isomerase